MRSTASILGIIALTLLLGLGSLVASAQTTTVTFWKHTHPPADALTRDLIKQFEAENPGVRIVLESFPHDQYTVRLLTALATGSGPDIFDLSDTDFLSFSQTGSLAPLDVEALGYADYDAMRADWLPTVLDAWSGEDGQVFGLPFEFNSWQLFINEDHFIEAGLDPEKDAPRTWDELLAVAEKLTIRDARGRLLRSGFGLPYNLAAGWYILYFEPIVWQWGGGLLTEDGTRSALTTEPVLKAAAVWAELVQRRGITSPTLATHTSANPNQDFATGNYSMWISGPWAPPTLNGFPVDGRYRVVPLPQVNPDEPMVPTSSWAWLVSANSNAERRAWATKFIDFASKAAPNWLEQVGYVVPRQGWFDTPEAQQFETLDVFLEGMSNGRPRVRTTKFNEVSSIVQKALQEIAFNQVAPKDAMEKAERELNNVLAK